MIVGMKSCHLICLMKEKHEHESPLILPLLSKLSLPQLKCGAVTEEEIDSIDDDMVYAFLEELSIFSELETLAASNMGIAYNTIFKKTKNEVM